MGVLVTGGTGFIAQHVIKLLLSENYKVITTVRSQAKADKLKKQFNNSNLSFEVVESIVPLDAFNDLFKRRGSEISYVIHMASPVTFDVKDNEQDILIPAVNGTKAILNAIKEFTPKTIKHVVYTSSVAAMMDLNNPTETLTEENWNPVTWDEAKKVSFAAYAGSKTFAEKAAWDFFKENEGKISCTLTTVNPVFVFGPQTFDEDARGNINFSCEVINKVIHSGKDAKVTTKIEGSFIDVRDVAKAHVAAIQKEELKGKRLLMSEQSFSNQDTVNILVKHFPELKEKLPPSTSDEMTSKSRVHNQKTRALLGFPFKTFENTITDMTRQILSQEGK